MADKLPSSEYPRFVPNNAEGEDKFKEQAHSKLSKAISELISKKEPKSKILGLEGGWGSGKSNIIRLVEKKLLNTHHVYIHDVWGFQEDLQRRTFLESLTTDLCYPKKKDAPAFLLNKPKWDEELKKLLARTQVTTTDVIPVFSPGFMFVICWIVLWTISGDFVGPIYIGGGGEIHKRMWVLLFGIVGYLIFSWRACKFLTPKDVFYLYNEADTKKVTSETIFDEEPSPERFNKWITDLQKDFPKDKELIVVFDNMDRLPKEKVGQIWSLVCCDR